MSEEPRIRTHLWSSGWTPASLEPPHVLRTQVAGFSDGDRVRGIGERAFNRTNQLGHHRLEVVAFEDEVVKLLREVRQQLVDVVQHA